MPQEYTPETDPNPDIIAFFMSSMKHLLRIEKKIDRLLMESMIAPIEIDEEEYSE